MPKVISDSDDVISIDLEDPDFLKDFNTIFIEGMSKLIQGASFQPLSKKNIERS